MIEQERVAVTAGALHRQRDAACDRAPAHAQWKPTTVDASEGERNQVKPRDWPARRTPFLYPLSGDNDAETGERTVITCEPFVSAVREPVARHCKSDQYMPKATGTDKPNMFIANVSTEKATWKEAWT